MPTHLRLPPNVLKMASKFSDALGFNLQFFFTYLAEFLTVYTVDATFSKDWDTHSTNNKIRLKN